MLLLWLAAGCRYGFATVDSDSGSVQADGDGVSPGAGGVVVAQATVIDNGARVNCPEITSDGNSFAMIWWDDRLARNMTWKLYFRRFTLDGAPLGSELVFDAPGAGDNCMINRELFWTGSQYALLYTATANPKSVVMLANIAADGTLMGAPLQLTSGSMDQHFNASAWLGSSIGVVYTERLNGTTDEVRHLTSTLAGVVTNDAPVSGTVTQRTSATTAVTAGGEAVVWIESNALHYSYVAPLPTNNITVTTDATLFSGTDPDSIQIGSKQLLLYEKNSVQEYELLSVDPSTAAPSGSPLTFSQIGGSELHAVGTSLVMTHDSARLELLDASGNPTGQLLGPPTGSRPSAPSVAAVAGGELAFAWQEYDPFVPWYRIRFARIAP